MSLREITALRNYLATGSSDRTLSDATDTVAMAEIAQATALGGRLRELAGRSVVLSLSTQLISGIAMIEIDGVARQMLLCPPDFDMKYAPSLIADAQIDAVVTDDPARWQDLGVELIVTAGLPLQPAAPVELSHTTNWLMLTSGTTGAPKIVAHTLAALTGAIVADGPAKGAPPTWATFYDIRRYGGLQIFLRAVLGGGSMVLSSPGEPIAEHLARLAARGVTHISGTPSHWRKALMSAALANFHPDYVRLSGEIADQAVLDSLRRAFPHASIGHAYASTEAGVGFAVNDGREGFPAVDDRRRRQRRRHEGRRRFAADPLDAHRAHLCRPQRAGADRCRRLRRHRRHGRAARRPLLLRRPPRRHHQCRRPQGASRRSRGGDQSPSRGADVANPRAAQPDHRRAGGRGRRARQRLRFRPHRRDPRARSSPTASSRCRRTSCRR